MLSTYSPGCRWLKLPCVFCSQRKGQWGSKDGQAVRLGGPPDSARGNGHQPLSAGLPGKSTGDHSYHSSGKELRRCVRCTIWSSWTLLQSYTIALYYASGFQSELFLCLCLPISYGFPGGGHGSVWYGGAAGGIHHLPGFLFHIGLLLLPCRCGCLRQSPGTDSTVILAVHFHICNIG